jgi:hypothetical protein
VKLVNLLLFLNCLSASDLGFVILDMGMKRKKIIFSEKLYVIRQVEANPTASRVEMANRLLLALSSCKIM